MSKAYLISDFSVNDVFYGGSEWVNQCVIDELNLEYISSRDIKSFNYNDFYIISNISLMNPKMVDSLKNYNYIILEHDYKICQSRHPWKYDSCLIPKELRTNYDLYKNAKAVFVQTTDHLNVFKLNEVEGNFINLRTSIWSKSDLDLLRFLNEKLKIKNDKSGVYYTTNWIKNTKGNLEYCSNNKLPVHIIKENNNREEFLRSIGSCKNLVFYPLARETFCRLVVEAKSMGVNVITSKNYGASLEPWFDKLSGDDLINFLEIESKNNILKIKNFL